MKKYREQKTLGHMPGDTQTHHLFAEAAAVYELCDDAVSIGFGTEYIQYWIDQAQFVDGAYKL